MNEILSPIERQSFSTLDKIMDMPDLVEIQTMSYEDFLQADINEDKRKEIGIEQVFREIFPIHDFNETAVLEYVSYTLDKPKYNPREAVERNTTYAAPLKVRVRLVTYDINEESGEKSVLSAKESEVYLCDLPLMTEKGSFVVNGVERVIVNQLHRSPGIFFEDVSSSKNILDKHIFSARIIPYRGSWIDFEFDSKNLMYVRIDKKRKIPVTAILKALGLNNQEILKTYYEMEIIHINIDGSLSKDFDADKILGRRNSFDIIDENGEVIIKANYKITKAAKKRLVRANIKQYRIGIEDIIDTFFAEDVIDEDGEVLIEANTPVNEDYIELLKDKGINTFKVLFIDRLISDTAIRDLLAVDNIADFDGAIIELYKKFNCVTVKSIF